MNAQRAGCTGKFRRNLIRWIQVNGKAVIAMGVKFNREYADIVNDLVEAIITIDDAYEAFEMEREEWLSLDDGEKRECVRTLADDLFYGLGEDPRLEVGSGKVEYDRQHHVIKISAVPQVVRIVKLV